MPDPAPQTVSDLLSNVRPGGTMGETTFAPGTTTPTSTADPNGWSSYVSAASYLPRRGILSQQEENTALAQLGNSNALWDYLGKAAQEKQQFGKVISTLPQIQSPQYSTTNPFTAITGTPLTPDQIKAQNAGQSVQQPQAPASPTPYNGQVNQSLANPLQPTPQPIGQTNFSAPQPQLTASQAPTAAVSAATTTPQSGYINMNGAYFQQTPQGLAAVNDPNILNQLRSGQIQATSQAPGSQQFSSGLASPNLAPSTTPAPGSASTGGVPPAGGANPVENPDAILQKYKLDSTGIQSTPIADIIKQLSMAFGLDDIKNQMATLDNAHIDAVANINSNPWLSEGIRSKEVEKENTKYQARQDALVNRLKLNEDIVGKSIDLYYKQQTLENDKVREAIAAKQLEISSQTPEMKDYAYYKSQGGTESFDSFRLAGKTGNLKSLQGGLFDTNSGQWVVPPSASNGADVKGLTGNSYMDTKKVGYYSTPVAGGRTQAAVDQAALYVIAHGGALPPGIGLSSTGPGGEFKSAISNRAAELSAGQNIAANPERLRVLSESLNLQTSYAYTIDRSLTSADQGFQQVNTLFSQKGINNSNLTFMNIFSNAAKYQLNPTDISAFRAGLSEVANEYTQVFSRGGTVTDTVRNTASRIADGNISMAALRSTLQEVQAQGKIVKSNADREVQRIQNDINTLLSPPSSGGANDYQAYLKAIGK